MYCCIYTHIKYINVCILSRTDRYMERKMLLKKGDISITKNYRGITLTPIVAKIYYMMLLNSIR